MAWDFHTGLPHWTSTLDFPVDIPVAKGENEVNIRMAAVTRHFLTLFRPKFSCDDRYVLGSGVFVGKVNTRLYALVLVMR